MAFSNLVSLAKTLHYFAIEDKFHIFGDADDSSRLIFASLLGYVVYCLSPLQYFARDHEFHIFGDADYVFKRLESICGTLSYGLSVLVKYTRKDRQLEAQIGEYANEVECLIENYISDMISTYGQVIGKDIDKLILQTNESIENFSGLIKLMNDSTEDRSSPSHSYLPRNSDKDVHRKEVIVGLKDDLSKIKDRLFSHDSELVTIPIFGMGGIGKSTLAKVVYNDSTVIGRFDRRFWVTISYNHDVRATYSAILGRDSTDESTDIVELGTKVHQLLFGWRYLIVIDDIWKSNVWDDVRRVLPDNSKGSRVLLTTRDVNVASYVVSSSYIHYVKLMDEEMSWRLFEKLVFREEHCPPELTRIGEQIIRKCCGLPIAISVISGILSNVECTADAWNDIAEDVSGALSNGDERFTEILSLSYHRLPPDLKPCFLYFGSFPEDHEINASDLIRYWVADGFLGLDFEAYFDMEEIAYMSLSELFLRNLVVVLEYTEGKITKCKIHEVLREMCIRIAKEENFLRHNEDISVGKTRRASFSSRTSSHTKMVPESPIRVALCFRGADNSLLKYLQRFRLLRVLDVRCFALEEFPDQFLQLYHLRYLALRYKGGKFQVPTEICQLENLKSFIVEPKYFKKSVLLLPLEIWGMSKLRHLIIKDCVMPPPIPKISGLKNLKELSNSQNLKFEQHVVELIASVKTMDFGLSLKRELNETWSGFLLDNVQDLSHLEKLSVSLHDNYYEWREQKPFLQSIMFPYSLKSLSISGWKSSYISWEDVNNVIGSLPNLEMLCLDFVCIGCVWETKEGNFMKLRRLHILDQNLERWITDDVNHFPSLEEVVLGLCGRLIELPDCIGDIPTLRRIKLKGNQPCVNEWATKIEEEQRDIGNDGFIVIRGDAYREGKILGEVTVIEPTGDSISTDELVKKLKLWAGDDEIKFEQAMKAGGSYVMARVGRGEVPMSEVDWFFGAMKEQDKEEEEQVTGGTGGGSVIIQMPVRSGVFEVVEVWFLSVVFSLLLVVDLVVIFCFVIEMYDICY